MKPYFTSLTQLAIEISKRETAKGHQLDISIIKRVIRHICNIISEEWKLNVGMQLTTTMRQAGNRVKIPKG